MLSWFSRIPTERVVFLTRPKHAVPSRQQLSYLFDLWSVRQRITALLAALVLVITIPWALLRWYTSATLVVPIHGGTYIEGVVGDPQYLNPLLSALSDVDSDIVHLVFSSLFEYNGVQELEPDLVTEYTISDDQLTYTFTTRQDAKWHDGHALTVDDILFTIQSIQDPVFQSPLQSGLAGVVATRIDDTHFSLKLAQPYAPFLSTLTFGIIPQHLWYDVPGQSMRYTELNTRPIGSGPYEFQEFVRDNNGAAKSLTLKENEEYYSEKPYIPTVQFQFFPDVTSAVDALSVDKISGLGFIPVDNVATLKKTRKDLHFTTLKIPQYTALFFNETTNAALKNNDVRTALSYAVNRDDLIQHVFAGAAEPIFTPILPGYLGYNPEVDKHLTNIDQSMKILEDGGWKFPDGVTADQVVDADHPYIPRAKSGVNLEFTVSTVDTIEYQKTLEILQQSFYRIGAKMNIAIFSAEDIQNEVIKPRRYEGLLFSEIVGTDPDPYPFWHSSQQKHPGLALSIFRDRDVDKLLEEARKTNNTEERRLKYLHVQNNLADEVPALFLYNALYTYAVSDRVLGLSSQQYITTPADRFSDITSWYIKTHRIWK